MIFGFVQNRHRLHKVLLTLSLDMCPSSSVLASEPCRRSMVTCSDWALDSRSWICFTSVSTRSWRTCPHIHTYTTINGLVNVSTHPWRICPHTNIHNYQRIGQCLNTVLKNICPCTHTHMHTHTHNHQWIGQHLNTVLKNLYTHMLTQMHVHPHTHIHTHTHTHTHISGLVMVLKNLYAHTHMHASTHSHTHAHTHTQSSWASTTSEHIFNIEGGDKRGVTPQQNDDLNLAWTN